MNTEALFKHEETGEEKYFPEALAEKLRLDGWKQSVEEPAELKPKGKDGDPTDQTDPTDPAADIVKPVTENPDGSKTLVVDAAAAPVGTTPEGTAGDANPAETGDTNTDDESDKGKGGNKAGTKTKKS